MKRGRQTATTSRGCLKKTRTDSMNSRLTSNSPSDNIPGPSTADPASGLTHTVFQPILLPIDSSDGCLDEVEVHKEKLNLHQRNCVECALSHTATQTIVIGCSVLVDSGHMKIVWRK